MNVEHALLTVADGQSEKFEEAFKAAQEVIVKADGCLFVDLLRQTGSRTSYLLIVAWASHSAATEGFRSSEFFAQWNELLTPYYSTTPDHIYFDLLSHFPPDA
ncbi:antibiotic biosynthesis monooxygenase family protein [Streptomyces sp. MZ04]|uniref:antibiotic biosynthesis monooxygenase family protein n=1 Tax=Streptomyces sp. MZ04 TaxID=2559236 RepID=UPI001432A4E2|nr:antibiotic biosynthesis monooxygenase family protein [Streptomyces sp. MZ04]